MKHILLVVFVFASLLQARAGDTLTIRQVFNFNVGDTFDYRYYYNNNAYPDVNSSLSGENYSREIITAKRVSLNNDTFFYEITQVSPRFATSYIYYTDLDSDVIFYFGRRFGNFVFDTAHFQDGRPSNQLSCSYLASGILKYQNYAKGLGITYADSGNQSPFVDPITSINARYSQTLIYYAKGNARYGLPYYYDTVIPLAHYTPIPEDCAFWNYTIHDSTHVQLRTGQKFPSNSHTYVELIYRGPDATDSTVGYFRNDTVNKRVLFKNNLTSPEWILYDFTLNENDSLLPSYKLSLYTTFLAGSNRTEWVEELLAINTIPAFFYYDYVEGIGSITDLFHVYPNRNTDLGNGNCVSYYELSGSGGGYQYACRTQLTSFCVCGQIIYPYNGSGECSPLSVPVYKTGNTPVKVFPNPAIDMIHVSFPDANQQGAQLILSDILGQEVYISAITESESMHNISKIATGIYTWKITSNNQTIKTGKIIKE